MSELGWRDAVFSLKTFAAAMLAVWIAFQLPLPQPGWSMLTVYIVSQPLAGMVLSKAVFRVVGTFVGAVMALVLIQLFIDAPELFLLALALWIGGCTCVAVYLRDVPAAYGAMLSGYSAAIVGLPAALAPDAAFDYAWARCLEITLGIGCATLLSRIVLPRTAGGVLQTTLDAALGAAAQWTGDVLRGQGEAAKGLADRRRLVADILTLESLRAHAVFDTPAIRAADRVVRHLQARMMMLLSVLVGIHDRLALLHRDRPAVEATLRPVLERAAGRMTPRAGEAASAAEADELDREIEALLPPFAELQRDRERLLDHSILLRLGEVRRLWREIGELHRRLLAGSPAGDDTEPPPLVRYRDPALAMAGGLVSATAVLAAAAFWIASAWSQGTQVVMFAGVVGSIMAGLDDPATAATGFLEMTVYAVAVAAIYLFGVFPRIDGFTELVVVLLPFYLPFGMIMALPRIGTTVLPLVLNTTALLSITDERTVPDLAAYLNTALGLVAGIALAVLMFRLLRPLGVGWTVRRLVAGTVADLARIAGSRVVEPRLAFESRMFDRIDALFTRLDPAEPEQRATMQGALASLRVGLNLLGLKAVGAQLAADLVPPVDTALTALARTFEALTRREAAPSPLPAIDAAMDRLLAAGPLPGVMRALVVLGGIRTSLTQHPGFFARPESAAPAAGSALPMVPA